MRNKEQIIKKTASVTLATAAVLGGGLVMSNTVKADAVPKNEDINTKLDNAKKNLAQKQAAETQASGKLGEAESNKTKADQDLTAAKTNLSKASQAASDAQKLADEAKNPAAVKQANADQKQAQADLTKAKADQIAAGKNVETQQGKVNQAQMKSDALDKIKSEKKAKADKTKKALDEKQTDFDNSQSGKAKNAADAADKAADQADQAQKAAKVNDDQAKINITDARNNQREAENNQQKAISELGKAEQDASAKHKIADQAQKAAEAKQIEADQAQTKANQLKADAEKFASDTSKKDAFTNADQANTKAQKILTSAEKANEQAPKDVKKAEGDLGTADKAQQTAHADLTSAQTEQIAKRVQSEKDAQAVTDKNVEIDKLSKTADASETNAEKLVQDTSYKEKAYQADKTFIDLTKQHTQVQTQIGKDQSELSDKKIALNRATGKVDELKTAAKKAKDDIDAKNKDIANDKEAIDKNNAFLQNRIVLSKDYRDAIHKYISDKSKLYDKVYEQQYKLVLDQAKQGIIYTDRKGNPISSEEAAAENTIAVMDSTAFQKSADNTKIEQELSNLLHKAGQAMLKAMPSYPYRSNQTDLKHIVNLDNMSAADFEEINDYALKLLNDIRNQLGLRPFVMNSSVQQMAKDIAKAYNADGRSISNGNAHDAHAINEVAKDYGLDYVHNLPKSEWDSHEEYYEDMGGFAPRGSLFVGKFSGIGNDLASGYDYNPLTVKLHETTMDSLKQGVINNLLGMFLCDDTGGNDWGHTKDLLCLDSIKQQPLVRFGFSISMLPNASDYSEHFITVKDTPSYMLSGNKINTTVDTTVASVSDEQDQLTANQNKLTGDKDDLTDLDKAKDKADAAVTDNANQITKLTAEIKQLGTKIGDEQTTETDLATKLDKAKLDKETADTNLDKHNKEVKQAQATANSDAKAVTTAQTELTHLKTVAEKSAQDASAQDKLVTRLQGIANAADQVYTAAQGKLADAQKQQTKAVADLVTAQAEAATAQANLTQAKKDWQNYQDTLSQKRETARTQQTTATQLANDAKQLADTYRADAKLAKQADDVVDAKTQAKTAADNAKAKADQAVQDVIKAQIETAKILSAAKQKKVAAQKAKQQADSNLAKYKAEVARKEADLNAAKVANRKAQNAYTEAETNANKAKAAWNKAKADLATAKAVKTKADQNVTKARTNLNKANQHIYDLQNANTNNAKIQADLTKAQKAYDDAQTAAKTAKENLDQAQKAYDVAKTNADQAQKQVDDLTSKKQKQDEANAEHNRINSIVDNTVNSLRNADNDQNTNTNSENINNTKKNDANNSVASKETKSSENTQVIKKTKKTTRYYTLSKRSRILRKLKRNHSVKYVHIAVLRGKKNLHFVKITKHDRVHKIWRKMKAHKEYRVLKLRHIGGRYYAQIKTGKHSTAWINIKYIKFVKNAK